MGNWYTQTFLWQTEKFTVCRKEQVSEESLYTCVCVLLYMQLRQHNTYISNYDFRYKWWTLQCCCSHYTVLFTIACWSHARMPAGQPNHAPHINKLYSVYNEQQFKRSTDWQPGKSILFPPDGQHVNKRHTESSGQLVYTNFLWQTEKFTVCRKEQVSEETSVWQYIKEQIWYTEAICWINSNVLITTVKCCNLSNIHSSY